MPMLEMKQLNAFDLEAQRTITAVAHVNYWAADKKTTAPSKTQANARTCMRGSVRRSETDLKDGFKCCLLLSLSILLSAWFIYFFSLGSASCVSCAGLRCSKFPATLSVLCQSPPLKPSNEQKFAFERVDVETSHSCSYFRLIKVKLEEWTVKTLD